MKKKIIWAVMICSLGSCYGQRSFELSYHSAMIDQAPIGKVESPKVYELGIGIGGDGGTSPYWVFNVGQSRFSYTDTLYGRQDFRGLICGGTMGIRPLSRTHCIRFQPLVQLSFKRSLTGKSTNSNGGPEPVLLEGESNSKLSKIAYFGIGTGFEFFLMDNFSISPLLSFDRLWFNSLGTNSFCLNFKIKYYITY